MECSGSMKGRSAAARRGRCAYAETRRLLGDDGAEVAASSRPRPPRATGSRLSATVAQPHPRPPGRRARRLAGRPAARARRTSTPRRGPPRDLPARPAGRTRRNRGRARRRRGRGAALRHRRVRSGPDRHRPGPPGRRSTGRDTTASFMDALADQTYEAARAQGEELTTKTRSSGRAGPEAHAGARPRLGIADPNRGESRRTRRRRPHQPGDRRADVHLPETVKTHLAHIFPKIDVHSRAELVGRSLRRDPAGGPSATTR